MKLAVISDLHIDMNKEQPVIEALCEYLRNNEVTAVIIAGDISNDYCLTLSTVEKIRDETKKEVYFVPGNHDYWNKENGEQNTWNIYERYKKARNCLTGGAIVLNDDWVLIGDSGWYDYSFGEKHYTSQEFDRMHAFDRTWKDALYTNWEKSNIELNDFFYNRLLEQIEQHQSKKIVFVTHMLAHPYFKVQLPRETWDYFNAFLGSDKYMNLLAYPSVKYAVMGHVHYRKIVEYKGTKCICACLGYTREWQGTDVQEEIKNTVQIIAL